MMGIIKRETILLEKKTLVYWWYLISFSSNYHPYSFISSFIFHISSFTIHLFFFFPWIIFIHNFLTSHFFYLNLILKILISSNLLFSNNLVKDRCLHPQNSTIRFHDTCLAWLCMFWRGDHPHMPTKWLLIP